MDAGLDKRGPLSISKVETQVRIRYFSPVTLNIYHKIAVIGCRPRISSFLERNQAFRTIVLPMKVEHLSIRHLETSKLQNINIKDYYEL